MLNRAIQIATAAHVGQVDKAGEPYILHPLRVMVSGVLLTEDQRICAVLHDVVEDTDWTFERPRSEGFSEEIIAALDCLTKRDGEEYEAFIKRAGTNPIACRVKTADLLDNADLSRIKEPTQVDIDRVKKYHDALFFLAELDDEGGFLTKTDNSKLKEIAVDVVISVQNYVTFDDFSDQFTRMIENNGWFYGGGLAELDDEGNPVR